MRVEVGGDSRPVAASERLSEDVHWLFAMRDMFSTAVYGVCEEQLAYEEYSTFWEYLRNFTRFWGVVTAVVMFLSLISAMSLALKISIIEYFELFSEIIIGMANIHAIVGCCVVIFKTAWKTVYEAILCGVGVDIAAHHHTIGIYYVIASFLVFFLEITWIITLFIQLCVRNEFHPCLICWSKILWFRLWKRSLLYAIFAAVLFLKPHRLWLSMVSGIQLLLLSSLYLMLTYRSQKRSKLNPSPRLLTHTQHNDEYDKYEDITDVLDDTLPSPILGDQYTELEQDNILENL